MWTSELGTWACEGEPGSLADALSDTLRYRGCVLYSKYDKIDQARASPERDVWVVWWCCAMLDMEL